MRQSAAPRIRKRIPIRTRFLTSVLLTTILSILAVSATGFLCIRRIRRASEQTLTEQLEINLQHILAEKADAVDARLEHYEKYIELITDTIEDLYGREEEAVAQGREFGPPTDTGGFLLTRAFASADLTAEELGDEIRFFSNLEAIWAPIARENRDLISTMYLGTRNGLLASYDRYSYLSCPPEGEELVYNYFPSEWYRRGLREKGVFYTGVYMDSQGRGLTVTIGSGFRGADGHTAGVACMDFDLTALYQELFAAGLDDGTFIFALDHQETVIAPDSDTMDLREFTGLSLDELDALKADEDGIMVMEDSVYVCVPMERVGWTLCACVPRDAISRSIHHADRSIWNAFTVFAAVVVLILLVAVITVNKSVHAVTYPLELLGRDIKIISNGDLDYRATVFRNDEIGDITSGMNEMVDRLNFTLRELMSSQRQADAMSRLATLDTLTGIRNKTAFDRQKELLVRELQEGKTEFGFAVLDLNNLKLINDNFGHEKGDIAIKNLCHIVCEVFDHSPVYRVGGDEFVVVLKNEDYRNVQSLVTLFRERIRAASGDPEAEPWDRVSAAIGVALYDEARDSGTETVLARADKEMYNCKRRMKGL